MLFEPVFIVGCPRSGTTLVAAKLDGSSELAVAPETHFFSHWLPQFPALTSGRREDFDRFWSDFRKANFRWFELDEAVVYEQLAAGGRWDAQAVFSCLLSAYTTTHGKTRSAEKTPTHYRAISTLLKWFPSARVVFVVRDPRAVVSSYFDLAERASWARGNAFEVARRWLDAASSAERWEGDSRVSVIRYETFVSEPATELEHLFNFLGLKLHAGPPTPTIHHAGAGGLIPSAEISTNRISAWQSKLQSRDLQVIERLCVTKMRRFGYEPATHISFAGIAAVAAQAMTKLISETTGRVTRSRRTPDVAAPHGRKSG